MNLAQIHLGVNHLPVVGVPLLTVLLAFGLKNKSRDQILAAWGLLVGVSMGAAVAFFTGEGAEHVLAAVSDVGEGLIEPHEEAAEFAFAAAMALGGLSLFGFIFERIKKRILWPLVWLTLIGGLFVSATMARTAHLGGLIRHPEIVAK